MQFRAAYCYLRSISKVLKQDLSRFSSSTCLETQPLSESRNTDANFNEVWSILACAISVRWPSWMGTSVTTTGLTRTRQNSTSRFWLGSSILFYQRSSIDLTLRLWSRVSIGHLDLTVTPENTAKRCHLPRRQNLESISALSNVKKLDLAYLQGD